MTRARSLSQLANSSVFTVATNNRVGIGSEVPTAKLDVDGTLNVSGNATIGGVATYEDVTNVDSVGIVTARSGVSVPDGQKIQLGNSNDLQIYHTGSHSLIDEAGTGNLTIRSSLISFEKYTNEQLARFTADGSCELFHNNSKKLETTSTGLSVTGAALVDSPSASTGGVEISRYGVYIRSDDSYSKAFAIHNGGYTASDETILFNSDGSAAFSSSITAQNTILANRTGSTQTAFQATLSGVTKVNIEAGGAANFASHLITGSANSVTSTSAHGSYIGEGIVVNAIQPNATLAAQERVWLGKLANVTKSQIFKDGSATFAGKLTVNNQAEIYRTAAVGGSTSGNTLLNFKSDVGGTAVTKASITTDGSAEFANNLDVGAWKASTNSLQGARIYSTGYIQSNRTSSNGGVFTGSLSGSVTSQILANGSATFGQASNSTNNNGILLGANVGQLNLYTTRYSTDCFQILNTSGSGTNVAVRFDGDGSATFAGTIAHDFNSNYQKGIRLMDNGGHSMLDVNGTGADATAISVYDGTGGGAYKVKIKHNGSAEFVGDILCGTDTNVNNDGVKIDSSGIIYALRPSGSTANLFQGGVVGSGTNVQIKADGSAVFSGGNINLYANGSAVLAQGATFGNNIILGTSNTTAVTQIYSNGSTGGVHLSGGGGGSANIEVYSASHASLAKTMRFQTNSLERMRIDSSGRVLIGVLSNYANGACDDLVVGNNSASGTKGITIGSVSSGQISFADASNARAGIIHYEHTDDSMRFYTAGATNERIRLLGSGGLTFNGDTAAANALDDYEEGTFTPTFMINGSTAGVTYHQRAGAYIKVGHKVTIWGRVSLTNNGSSSGQASIGSLPFTVADVVATTGIDGGGHMTYQNNVSGIYGPIVLSAEDGGTHVDFRAATTTNGNMATAITQNNIANDGDFRFVITYQTT